MEFLQTTAKQRHELIRILFSLMRIGLIDYSEKNDYIDYFYERN